MKISFTNGGSAPVRLHYDRHGAEGGIVLEPSSAALVTIQRSDVDEIPVWVDLREGTVSMTESATAELLAIPENTTATWPYDENGRLTDPAELQQDLMLGLYDLCSDAAVAEFSTKLVEELHQLRHRFIDEFEERFPGYGSGRAIWR